MMESSVVNDVSTTPLKEATSIPTETKPVQCDEIANMVPTIASIPTETKPVPSHKKAKAVSKAKMKELDSWDPVEFMRDAEHFALTFGLPNEGLNPLKITDITDQMLIGVFGEKSRNGYKLNNCTGLLVDDLVELSQVVDGYDKPVNGVLLHSFVKGVYAERIQRRKVNWAAYASAKLKGQISQWEREKKSKPVGPPCIRKPRQYKPPLPEDYDRTMKVSLSEQQPSQPLVQENNDLPQALVVFGATVGEVGHEDFSGNIVVASPPKERRWTSSPLGEKQPLNLLLAILRQSMTATAANERQLTKQIGKVQESLEALQKAELDQPNIRFQLQQEVETAQAEFVGLGKQIESTEADIENLISDIELEGNKEDSAEVNSRLL
jgi:hypothetical protein